MWAPTSHSRTCSDCLSIDQHSIRKRRNHRLDLGSGVSDLVYVPLPRNLVKRSYDTLIALLEDSTFVTSEASDPSPRHLAHYSEDRPLNGDLLMSFSSDRCSSAAAFHFSKKQR